MIAATTKFTEREMRVARRNHQRRRRLVLWLFPLLGLIYAAWGLWRLTDGGSQEGLYILAIVVGIYLVFRTPILNFRGMRILRRHPQLNQLIQWTFTEEGFNVQSDGSTLSTRWDQLYETVSTREGHLLYPQKGLFYWIPNSAFSTPSDDEALRGILRTKTRHHELA